MSDHRVLVTVAHPDDETFGTGSLIAHASASGAEVTVCCATRGEAGEVETDVATGDVGALRESELRAAAAHLGAARVHLLGLLDSGMQGDPPPGSLQATSPQEIAAQVAEVIDEVRPTVLITLDGSDGHRDHLRIRDVAVAAAARSSWSVDRIYLSCLPRALMTRWLDAVRREQPDSEHLDLAALSTLGTPEEQITTVIDTSAHYRRRWEAIRLHRSQRSPYEVMPPALQRAFLATDRLRRIRPGWTDGALESDFLPARA